MTIIKNKANISAEGIVYKSSVGAFSGLDGGFANNIMQSAGISVAPTFKKSNMFRSMSGIFTAQKGYGYIITSTSTVNLPTSPSTGDTIFIVCDTSSNVVVTAYSGQVISIQSVISNYQGTATSAARGNALTLVYNSSDTSWIAIDKVGVWTLNAFNTATIGASTYFCVDGADPLANGAPPATGTSVIPIDKCSIKTFSQPTTSRRPIYNSAVLNGLGALQSNSANNTSLSVSSGITLSTTTSIIILAQPSSTTNAYMFGGSGISNSPAIISNFAGLNYEFYDSADRYTISASATGFNLIEVYQTDASNVQAILNGVLVFTNIPTMAINSTNIVALFCSTPALNTLTGYIAEICIYRSILTNSQKINMRRYMAQKWGLAIPS